MRTLTIYGVDFEVIKPKKSNISTFDRLFTMSDCRTLHDCYAKPSQSKLNIWAWWRSWFAQVLGFNGISFKQFCGVSSYNCFFFTLHGLLTYNGEDYIVYITHAHNRLIKVVE